MADEVGVVVCPVLVDNVIGRERFIWQNQPSVNLETEIYPNRILICYCSVLRPADFGDIIL